MGSDDVVERLRETSALTRLLADGEPTWLMCADAMDAAITEIHRLRSELAGHEQHQQSICSLGGGGDERDRTLVALLRARDAVDIWQDISTAPKGKKVIVSVPNGKNRKPITMMGRYWPRHTLGVADGYEDEDWVDQGDDGDSYMPAGWYEECEADDAPAHNITPTHWMPLPAPPSLEGTERDDIIELVDAVLESAAAFIIANMLCTDDDGNEVLMPRTNPGNKVGFAYAAGLRSLKSPHSGGNAA